MDREQEQLQHLGLSGICKESYKIIFSWWNRIFFQITVSLILPFCLVVLADMHISDHLIGKILNHHLDLYDTWSDDPRYGALKHKLIREWSLFGSFNVLYFFVGLLFLFLFSISAVVYTIACIYTANEPTFKKVMKVIPKVWKRLLVTFLWNFLIVLVYNVVAVVLLVLSLVLAISFHGHRFLGITLAIILVILYLIGLVYVNVIWHLASVVSVLEDAYGLRAMKKSKTLIKGKLIVTGAIFVLFQVLIAGVQVAYFWLVAIGVSLPVVVQVIIGIVCFFALLKLILLGLVVQTIVYLVCKSHHHEIIDKSCLAEHLEGYLGKYARIGGRGEDDQLEQDSV